MTRSEHAGRCGVPCVGVVVNVTVRLAHTDGRRGASSDHVSDAALITRVLSALTGGPRPRHERPTTWCGSSTRPIAKSIVTPRFAAIDFHVNIALRAAMVPRTLFIAFAVP